MKSYNIAVEAYKKFSGVEGNQHIASEYALKIILNLISKFKVNSVLELGTGIGTIPYTVLEYAKEKRERIAYTCTEANEFCLSQLEGNLGAYYEKIELKNNLTVLQDNTFFDLIIVDSSDENLEAIKKFCKPHSIIFVEGYRMSQVNIIRKIFPKVKHVTLISTNKEPDYGPKPKEKWSGGGQVLFINPTFKQLLFWINHKFYTSFKYKVIRKLKEL
ncbi:hypothetical protein GTQ40_02470 [Flavobacteriaceae bacterium R38]|nr:hypothetical protein [Flavobacteriaceae bacterium R38]